MGAGHDVPGGEVRAERGGRRVRPAAPPCTRTLGTRAAEHRAAAMAGGGQRVVVVVLHVVLVYSTYGSVF